MIGRGWIFALLLLSLPLLAEEPRPKGLLHRMQLQGGVGDIRFSPDGKMLAAGGFDRSIRIYETESGKILQTLSGHRGRVTCVVWSPDGRTLASGSDDGSIRFWDVQAWKETGVLERAHTGGTNGTGTTTLGFFPDGKTLFSTGYDPLIRIWDVAELKEIRNLPGHRDCVVACLSADGKMLASTSQDGTARVWDPATGKSLGDLNIEPKIVADARHLGYPCFTPDGRRLFAGGGDGRLRSWVFPGLKQGAGWIAHRGFIGALDVSPDGSLLASGGMHPRGGLGTPDQKWDNAIQIWDAGTGEKLLYLEGHDQSVSRCRFSSGGTRLATSSWDGSIVIWDLAVLDLTPGKAAEEDAEALWTRLGEAPGPRPWAGVRAAVSNPGKALDLFGSHLQPAAPDPEFSGKLVRLIEDLDADDAPVREKAEQALIRLGPRAESALHKVLDSSPSAEVEMRAHRILEKESAWAAETEEERRWVRSVRALEEIGGEKATAILGKLAAGDADSTLTALVKASLRRLKGR